MRSLQERALAAGVGHCQEAVAPQLAAGGAQGQARKWPPAGLPPTHGCAARTVSAPAARPRTCTALDSVEVAEVSAREATRKSPPSCFQLHTCRRAGGRRRRRHVFAPLGQARPRPPAPLPACMQVVTRATPPAAAAPPAAPPRPCLGEGHIRIVLDGRPQAVQRLPQAAHQLGVGAPGGRRARLAQRQLALQACGGGAGAPQAGCVVQQGAGPAGRCHTTCLAAALLRSSSSGSRLTLHHRRLLPAPDHAAVVEACRPRRARGRAQRAPMSFLRAGAYSQRGIRAARPQLPVHMCSAPAVQGPGCAHMCMHVPPTHRW